LDTPGASLWYFFSHEDRDVVRTQVRAAEELGIDRSYISDMERGKKNVCLPTMEVLAQGFEISLAQLVRGLDREEPSKKKR
jgi:transcriptional regulator with XRE-family HTH domain